MKLLYCPTCSDLFALRLREERRCACGQVTGRYVNREQAVTNGRGISLAIGNGSLREAIVRMMQRQEEASFAPVMCWVRRNEGPSNPNTTVEVGNESGR